MGVEHALISIAQQAIAHGVGSYGERVHSHRAALDGAKIL